MSEHKEAPVDGETVHHTNEDAQDTHHEDHHDFQNQLNETLEETVLELNKTEDGEGGEEPAELDATNDDVHKTEDEQVEKADLGDDIEQIALENSSGVKEKIDGEGKVESSDLTTEEKNAVDSKLVHQKMAKKKKKMMKKNEGDLIPEEESDEEVLYVITLNYL